jgi:hypothetical protein
MGYTYDKGKISVHHETATENVATNLFDEIVLMDDDQINAMTMISCERYTEMVECFSYCFEKFIAHDPKFGKA